MPRLNIYLLEQHQNTGYDTYDSCVVAARTPEDAVRMNPDDQDNPDPPWNNRYTAWARSPDKVTCTLIGRAVPDIKRGVIIASFNAG